MGASSAKIFSPNIRSSRKAENIAFIRSDKNKIVNETRFIDDPFLHYQIMNEQEFQTASGERRRIDYLWLLACALITATAAFLRFFQLELKPMHHDEGVNGYFLTTLFRDGVYKYDPANYHGPDLYYFALFFSKMFGLNTLSVRASVAIFGVLTVALAFFLKNYIGRIGSARRRAFSRAFAGNGLYFALFYSRNFFVFFSFGIVVARFVFHRAAQSRAFRGCVDDDCFCSFVFCRRRSICERYIGRKPTGGLGVRAGVFSAVEAALVFFVLRMLLAWNEGRPIYLMLASASAVLLFATKETAFITSARWRSRASAFGCGAKFTARRLANRNRTNSNRRI
jgi:predicted membrane-bound mannosyltransferase